MGASGRPAGEDNVSNPTTDPWKQTRHTPYRRLKRQRRRLNDLHAHLTAYHSMRGHPTTHWGDHGGGAFCTLTMQQMRYLHADQHWPRRGLSMLMWRPWLRLFTRSWK